MTYNKIVRNLNTTPLDSSKHYHIYKILTTKEELSKGVVELVATNEKTYSIDLADQVDQLKDGDCIVDDGHVIVALYLEQ
ncbi:hypothetical protein JM47_02775 [Ureaplasma diversum]|uniref:Uncharacterized protein n=2 Tax=Ureaplasma diversum TaxID=42094 RepID=A0A084EXQ6_9BACT|nr:hypothetical protein [Ureaplasma diversum]AJQ45480.1 hypothetical protein JM47_02775 [Ureaplasma diversum]KEZ22748.1 hypothetical protein UDIV_4890 [Ureaplasma diversum NCTC 246]